ncbi:U-box domain-containing protein 17-like [Phalaenopsis equestris]|uniref:U-box domain-containing protein 17-like n=1 Tax=Phalaenopsis equestris TaxID=78828 RepID=UPI0009E31BB0|nr:U-box domain-containing protein 17-like [Phalaenopsis equestris]
MAAAIHNILRKPPPPSAFFTPAGLSDSSLLELLLAVAGDIGKGGDLPQYQRRNARCLIRRIRTFLILIDFLIELRQELPSSAVLCFKEFYIVVHRARILLDYCFQSSRLWLLLHNREISGFFQDLEREISTFLDVLPLNELRLTADVREHIELLRRQVGSSKMCVDDEDEEVRIKVLFLLEEFGRKRIPDLSDLKSTFIDRIGMMNAGDFENEIEFLQKQIFNHEGAVDAEADLAKISGVIAVVRYSRFSLFGTKEVEGSKKKTTCRPSSPRAGEISAPPKDFCCPISLELMRDPVVLPTGQTYDRQFINQWIAGGNQTCPNSGQNLGNPTLIPNRAIHSLISHWCAANGVPSNSGQNLGIAATAFTANKAAIGANPSTR